MTKKAKKTKTTYIPANKKRSEHKKRVRGFLIFLSVLAILSLTTLGLRYFLFETAHVKTDGMWPHYISGDTVLINKLMDVTTVKRGSLVYASFSSAGDNKLIRRVCGVEGDEIIPRADGKKYLVPGDGSPEIDLGEAKDLSGGILQKGQYLLLCDELDAENALDGRHLGLVSASSFIGTPGVILWPFSRAGKAS